MPSEVDKKIYRFTAERFSQKGPVYAYYNDDETISVDIMTGFDCPIKNVNSYATVGLSASSSQYFEKRVHVELVGACESKIASFANVVSSIAIEHLQSGAGLIHGNVIEDILGQYKISDSMEHILLCTPFLWPGLINQNFDGRSVHWLMAVPISDSEYEHWKKFGYQPLIDTFEEKQIDVYDINRPSVL
tara:strand:- start:401 stop:967 length:567 start_codon:yes stop_codon:yes gene_type:complete